MLTEGEGEKRKLIKILRGRGVRSSGWRRGHHCSILYHHLLEIASKQREGGIEVVNGGGGAPSQET